MSPLTPCDIRVTGHIPGGFTVPEGERWRIEGPVTTDANVIVEGTLILRPGDSLQFLGVNEAAFVGGGLVPLATDVGLWVMHDGLLDAVGSPKSSWHRAAGDIAQGAQMVTLDADPIGWQVGDRIIVTPTTPFIASGYSNPANQFWLHFEDRIIADIDGCKVTLSAPTSWSHPSCELPDGRVMAAEVANLTRDVKIGGTPGGRSHVFIHSHDVVQTIRYVEFEHLSPLKNGAFVLGRWGVHFHHAFDGSRGSLVEGFSIHDVGGRAVVPHASHGTTWRDGVVYNTQLGEAYWWDQDAEIDNTNDTLYDHLMTARGDASGFRLQGGRDNLMRDCVATGHVANASNAGFLWPGTLPTVSKFDSEGLNVAHNNRCQGVRVWINGQVDSLVTGIVSYRNLGAGVAGAYGGTTRWGDVVTTQNGGEPFGVHALNQSFADCIFDASGAEFAVGTGQHKTPGSEVVVERCRFMGATRAGLHLDADPTKNGEKLKLIDCTFDANEFWMEPTVPAASVVRVIDDEHGDITLRRLDQQGTLRPEWNAKVTVNA